MSGYEFGFRVLGVAIFLAALLLIAVAACGGSSDERRDTWYYITVPVPDGRPVVCVTNDLEDALSCDWGNR